jgi:hypothetical protein
MKQESRQMRGFRGALLSTVFGAVSLCAMGGAAVAGPVTEAGETVGLALGAPLPEGVYFVNTASMVMLGENSNTTVFVNIPVVAWSTPWTVLGGRVEAYAAVPSDYVGVKGQVSTAGVYNPAALVGLAWNLGNGFGFSNFVGGYAPMNTPGLASNNWVFNERAALSYTANGYNLTAHVIYGAVGDNLTTHKPGAPDYINYDLTATKTFGKWEVGPVAFGTNDLSNGSSSYLFSAGGLVGYGFGPLSVQAYLTRSITADRASYGDGDTRFFVRLIVPLWNPKS